MAVVELIAPAWITFEAKCTKLGSSKPGSQPGTVQISLLFDGRCCYKIVVGQGGGAARVSVAEALERFGGSPGGLPHRPGALAAEGGRAGGAHS